MDLLLVISVVAALIWGAIFLRYGGLLGGLLAMLLAGCCFGHPFFNVGALTIDRVLVVVVFLQCLAYRRFGKTELAATGRSEHLLIAFLAVLVVSTFTHNWSQDNAEPVVHLLIYFLMPAATYWIARQTPLTERSATVLFATWVLFGIYLTFTAVAETQQAWGLVWPGYIGSTTYAQFLGRARGPLINPVGNGLLLSTALASALMLWPRLGRLGQLVLLVVTTLLLGAVYLTLTRSVWIGAAFALAVLVGLAMPRQWRVPVLGLTAVASVLVLAGTWQNFLAFKRDKALSAEEAAESVQLRPILAVVAWHMFLDRPIAGCGFAQYPVESKPYLSDRTTDLPLEKARPYIQHNVFLRLLTETGILGAGLFMALLGFWITDAWRLWRSTHAPLWARQCGLLLLALLAAYLPNSMMHDVSVIPMVNMVLFFVAGLSSGAARRYAECPRARAVTAVWGPLSAPAMG